MNIKNLIKNVYTLLLQKINALEYSFGLIQDYVIETQNNQNDGYTKWASGKLECWKRVSAYVDITSTWGSFYYGSVSSISYPVTFLNNPTVNITAQVNNGGGWLVPDYGNYSASGTGTLYFYRPSSQKNTAVTINIYCIGRWK